MKKIALLLAGCAAPRLARVAKPKKSPPPNWVRIPARGAAARVIPTIAADPSQGDGGVADFYNSRAPAPEKAGTLIRSEPQPEGTGLAEASQSIRILYSSVDGLGDKKTPIAVSGSLFILRG